MSKEGNRMSVREAWRLNGKLLALAAVALVAVVAIGTMWTFGIGWFQRGTADFRGETGQIEQVQADPDYRIAAYERFFDLCAAVQTKEQLLAGLRRELESGPSVTRAEQVRASITAVTAARAADIHQYNADAEKAGTAGQFRDSGLPHQLNIDEGKTQCTM